MEAEIALAIDSDPTACAIFADNISDRVRSEDIAQIFPGEPGDRMSDREKSLASVVGSVDVLVAGPPCQGHSDLNNHTRRRDPKNALYLKVARAVEVLRPGVVIIENVPPVKWDKQDVVGRTVRALELLGYLVEGSVIDASRFGVPQRRKRFILVASRLAEVAPKAFIRELQLAQSKERDVRWAFGDLGDVSSDDEIDRPSRMSSDNRRRAAHLLNNGLYDLPDRLRPPCHRYKSHTYKSVYGRMRWDHPAQTVTTGFMSMGQGRYLHPERLRTITPHEAARLQTFPDWYSWKAAGGRRALARLIGNAVPVLMMIAVGIALLSVLPLRAIRCTTRAVRGQPAIVRNTQRKNRRKVGIRHRSPPEVGERMPAPA